MTKKRIHITLDEDLLDEVRKHIPNLSGFVEDCLVHYLGYGDEPIFPTAQAEKELETIRQAQLNLYLLSDMRHLEDKQREEKLKVINRKWRLLANQYIDTFTIDDEDLNELCILTGESIKTIEDMLTFCYVTQPIDYNEFYNVLDMMNRDD